jgi:hypothetical protein
MRGSIFRNLMGLFNACVNQVRLEQDIRASKKAIKRAEKSQKEIEDILRKRKGPPAPPH